MRETNNAELTRIATVTLRLKKSKEDHFCLNAINKHVLFSSFERYDKP